MVISDTEAVYLYGLDIIAQQQTERLYYVHDGLGSVRQLVDTTGAVQATYAYDPFGVPLAGGDVYNPYQFTGEAWDAEVELLYLRARYYQPEVGRFITKDPWTGDYDRPATLNLFAYTLNNPANLVDRSGYQGCMDVHCEAPMVDAALKTRADQLERDYGILVGSRQLYRGVGGEPDLGYALWSDWRALELDILRWAARDFAAEMQGGSAAFKTRVGQVRVYKRQSALVVFGEHYRGFTSPFSISFSGFWWDDVAGQKWTVVHELAHWWDFGIGKNAGLLSGGMLSRGMWTREVVECRMPRVEGEKGDLEVRGWKKGRKTDGLNPREDWAESVAAYVYDDHAHRVQKEISRRRWRYVAEQMNPLNPKPYPWWDWMFEE